MIIYVVDDHDLMRDATTSVLRRLRRTAKVLDFENFERFLEAVAAWGSPDLLVLDLTLPGIVGCEGVRRARACCKNTYLAVYSASPALDSEQECIASGANVYIEKCTGSNAFVKTLQTFLDQ